MNFFIVVTLRFLFLLYVAVLLKRYCASISPE